MKKKLLAIATCLCMLTSLLPAVAMAAEYSDTAGHWAEESIARWSDAGVVQGFNGQFNPEGMMTRAEAAQVFANLLKLTGKADLSAYTDVAADAWYADAFAACVAQGIMNGVAADQMDPTGTVTREMFFVMFARALGIKEESSLNGSFADSSEISSWAKGYVYALVNNGYVNGTSAGDIAPKLNINRASVMALLDQTIAYYVVEDGTVELKESGVVLVLADNVTITGDADATVVVAAEGAKVSMKGYTGDATVSVVADDVALTNVPAGVAVTAAEGTDGVTVNGKTVTAGSDYTVPSQSSGGGSSGGGSSGGDDGGDTPTTPGTTPGGDGGDTPTTPGTTPGGDGGDTPTTPGTTPGGDGSDTPTTPGTTPGTTGGNTPTTPGTTPGTTGGNTPTTPGTTPGTTGGNTPTTPGTTPGTTGGNTPTTPGTTPGTTGGNTPTTPGSTPTGGDSVTGGNTTTG